MYIYVLYLYRVLERNSWWCRAGIRNRKSSERFVQSELVKVIQVWKVGHKTSQGLTRSRVRRVVSHRTGWTALMV
jgi:hypothetical protein